MPIINLCILHFTFKLEKSMLLLSYDILQVNYYNYELLAIYSILNVNIGRTEKLNKLCSSSK